MHLCNRPVLLLLQYSLAGASPTELPIGLSSQAGLSAVRDVCAFQNKIEDLCAGEIYLGKCSCCTQAQWLKTKVTTCQFDDCYPLRRWQPQVIDACQQGSTPQHPEVCQRDVVKAHSLRSTGPHAAGYFWQAVY